MATPLTVNFDEIDLDRVYNELEREGISVITGAISDGKLTEFKTDVSELIAINQNKTFGLIKPSQECNSVNSMKLDSGFSNMMKTLALRQHNTPRVCNSVMHDVLRVVIGSGGGSLIMHYDASVITALVPIEIPEGEPEEAGDLVIYPNRRPLRRFVLTNFVEKIIMQNKFARRHFSKKIRDRTSGAKIIRLVPGNLYLFWGYRSFHGNFECSSSALRVTLLFHFGDPHSGSFVSRLALASQRWRARKELA